jgi:hypothetical protein
MPSGPRRTIWKRLSIAGFVVAFFLLLLVAGIDYPATWLSSPLFWDVEMGIGFALVVLFIGDRLDLAYIMATKDLDQKLGASEDDP